MSFSLVYALFSVLLVLGVFLAAWRLRGWKAALGLSLLSLFILAALFFALVAVVTRNM